MKINLFPKIQISFLESISSYKERLNSVLRTTDVIAGAIAMILIAETLFKQEDI